MMASDIKLSNNGTFTDNSEEVMAVVAEFIVSVRKDRADLSRERITIEDMKKAVGHKARITFDDGSSEETYVESYQYDADEDKEPWIEFSPNRVDYQSSIASIEILD